ncbi:hypothetical protein N7467_010679 [Penicillium canescens]|nr:hypothetical protein N7467_010679 [Penicillium canescens]
MTRPSPSPVQWRQICHALNPKVHGVRNPRLSACAAPAVNNVTAPATTKRPFHTTQSRSIVGGRKTPHLHSPRHEREAKRQLRSKQNLPLDRDGFSAFLIAGGGVKETKEFQAKVKETYEAASGMLPSGVGLTTFKSVGEQLIKAAYSGSPTAAAIQSISIDVDAVYRIGHIVAGRNYALREWIQSACAKAKSRRALVFLVSRYMRLDGIDIHRDNEWIMQVQELALKEDFPPAIMVWAELLTWRGKNKEASKILEEKILPFITSTRVIPKPWTDITLDGTVSSPWRLYALANADDPEKVKEAMTRAALDFGEPVALTEMAISALANRRDRDEFQLAYLNNKNAWEEFDKYEQYMGMAATAGHDKACFYLANWYYRISRGDIPSPEKRELQMESRESRRDDLKNPWKKYNPFYRIPLFLSKWNKPIELSEYRTLTMDWHELAMSKGNRASALILALLLREDGLMDESRKMYDQAAAYGLPGVLPKKGLLELEDNWNNPEYTPPMDKIVEKLMPIF